MSVEEVRSKVQRILMGEFGSVRTLANDDFVLENESAVGFVRVIDWGDGDTIVKVYSPMLSDVTISPALYEWVATEGQQRWFAHARVFPDQENPKVGLLAWEYDLLGNFLDADELLHCVGQVMVGANNLDDELQKQFGGRRGKD